MNYITIIDILKIMIFQKDPWQNSKKKKINIKFELLLILFLNIFIVLPILIRILILNKNIYFIGIINMILPIYLIILVQIAVIFILSPLFKIKRNFNKIFLLTTIASIPYFILFPLRLIKSINIVIFIVCSFYNLILLKIGLKNYLCVEKKNIILAILSSLYNLILLWIPSLLMLIDIIIFKIFEITF